jgi:DNA-binding winged helix-turn-helix (wHTH) protein/tetratricopeptide (TPR) repeat protein
VKIPAMHRDLPETGCGPEQKLSFGPFRLDPAQNILWRDGKVLPLGPKVVHTLAILASHEGEVVAREELIRQVWGDAVVEENSLAHNISVLRKSLKEDPSDSAVIETVPRRGYRFSIKRRISPDITTSLQPDKSAEGRVATWISFRRWGVVAVAVGALVCSWILFVSNNGYHVLGKERRRTIAVIGFNNLSHRPDASWLSPALAEMLSAELATGNKFLAIPGENVARAKAELKLDDRDGFSDETLKRLRKDLDADLVISGAYTVLPQNESQSLDGEVRLDIRIQDAGSGETLATLSEVGDQAGLFDLVANVGHRLRQDLGAGAVTPDQSAQAKSSMSPNLQAVRLYAQGIDKLRTFDALGAREFLQQSIQADPGYALAHAALADALAILGYTTSATEEARIAFQSSSHLSLQESLAVEGRYRIAERDWQKAIAAYQKLVSLFPDDIEYGLKLASAQTAASDAHAALITLNSLRSLPQAAGGDPRISLKEYEAWKILGDFNHMENALSNAADTARKQGALLLLARARARQCWVERVQGKPEMATSHCQEARQIYVIAGDRSGEADAIRRLGDIVSSMNVQTAIGYYRQALAIEKDIGDIGGQAVMITMLGTEYSSQGDHTTAADLYKQAITIFQQLDDTLNVTGLMIDVGSELSAQGKLDSAREMYQSAFDSAARIGNKYIEALAKYNLGALQQLEGDLDGAQDSYQQAQSRLQEVGNKEYDIGLNKSLGEIAMAKGDLARARALYEHAVSLQPTTGQKMSAMESQLNLYALSLEEGKSPAQLEPSLRRVVNGFRSGNEIGGNNAANNQAMSVALLARCLASEGQSAAALETAEEATKIALKAEPNVRLSIAIIAARIRFDTKPQGDERRALQGLQETIVEAHKFGYVVIELEARLALGELELKAGDTSRGHAHLLAVEKEASSRGLHYLATRSRAA